ncbi:MAG: potassium transporter TrkA [Mycobacterium sp.]|nr:potassium transporter TrkA [Mycobacterium sp.]
MRDHIIVCGDDALAMRIIDELSDDDLSVVLLKAPNALEAAGIATAHAVIAASPDDGVNLEVALLARQANPGVRVVTRLSNRVLHEAMNDNNGPGAVLDVADLAAPSVVEAMLGRTAHTITAAGVDFVVATDTAARNGTLREIYGRLAPVAVIRGDSAPNPGEVIACPHLDDPVYPGDSTTIMGRAEELTAQGLKIGTDSIGLDHRSPPVRAFDRARAFHDDVNPMFYRAMAVAVAVLVGSTLMLRFGFQPSMGWVDALSFATETMTTVGYGDFNLLGQPLWLRLFGVALMLSGIALISLNVAFVADVLVSRRVALAADRQRVSHLSGHFVVVGLGSFGVRVASLLKDSGHAVTVVERNENNRYLSVSEELNIPVIVGDATLPTTLAAARADRARAVAVLTEDDMVNIETGLILRQLTGSSPNSRTPIVLRIYDKALGAAVGHRLDFRHVRSTVDLATPWFVGAAMGLDVLGTFSVGQRSFMVGGVVVQAGSRLDGTQIQQLSTLTRVIAVERDGNPAGLYPKRQTILRAGDNVYLVGPYHELLRTLRKGQSGHPRKVGPSLTIAEGLGLSDGRR